LTPCAPRILVTRGAASRCSTRYWSASLCQGPRPDNQIGRVGHCTAYFPLPCRQHLNIYLSSHKTGSCTMYYCRYQFVNFVRDRNLRPSYRQSIANRSGHSCCLRGARVLSMHAGNAANKALRALKQEAWNPDDT